MEINCVVSGLRNNPANLPRRLLHAMFRSECCRGGVTLRNIVGGSKSQNVEKSVVGGSKPQNVEKTGCRGYAKWRKNML